MVKLFYAYRKQFVTLNVKIYLLFKAKGFLCIYIIIN